MKIFSLEGKIAIVTGGAGLYGKHISSALAEAGALVIIASRDEQKCRDYAALLSNNHLKAEGMFLDLADEQNIQLFTKTIIENHGHIDILVNNAVSREGFKDLEQVTKNEWESSQQIN